MEAFTAFLKSLIWDGEDTPLTQMRPQPVKSVDPRHAAWLKMRSVFKEHHGLSTRNG